MEKTQWWEDNSHSSSQESYLNKITLPPYMGALNIPVLCKEAVKTTGSSVCHANSLFSRIRKFTWCVLHLTINGRSWKRDTHKHTGLNTLILKHNHHCGWRSCTNTNWSPWPKKQNRYTPQVLKRLWCDSESLSKWCRVFSAISSDSNSRDIFSLWITHNKTSTLCAP